MNNSNVSNLEDRIIFVAVMFNYCFDVLLKGRAIPIGMTKQLSKKAVKKTIGVKERA